MVCFSLVFVYLAVLITIVMTLLRGPFIGLVGYYILSFVRPQEIYWYSLRGPRLSFWIVLATIISFFLHRRVRYDVGNKANSFTWFFILFLFLAINSYVFSMNAERSFDQLVLLYKLMLMAMLTCFVVNDIGQIRILIVMLIFSFGVLAIHANYEYFFQGVWMVTSPGEPGGRGNIDNNGFAMQFVMMLPIAFFFFFAEKRNLLLKWGSAAMIPFMIHAIILTYSRGGFLGMVVVMVSCLFFLRKIIWGLFSGVAMFGVLNLLQGEQSVLRMESVYEYKTDPSAQGRFAAWEAGKNMMLNNPITGVGIGNFDINAPLYNPVLSEPKVAHNAYLHVGGEMGILAFILYVGIIIMAFCCLWQMRRLYKSKRDESPHYYYATALYVSLIGFVFCANFLSLNYLELYYFIVMLIGRLIYLYQLDLKGMQKDVLTSHERING